MIPDPNDEYAFVIKRRFVAQFDNDLHRIAEETRRYASTDTTKIG